MPRVFISSTVRDLGDLRSATKYWLEQLGFEVQASDFADFEHRPDAAAIEACYEGVRSSDLYVLIIGEEQGTMIDCAGEQVSITQGEYKAAYNSFRETGKPKIVSFVRTPMVPRNPEFTERFVSEIRRIGEEDQRANWTIPFASFRDIVDGLRGAIPAVRDPLPTQALKASLEDELLANLRTFTLRWHGAPGFLDTSMQPTRVEVRLQKEHLQGSYMLTHEQLQWMSLFASVGSPPADALSTLALDQAIASGQLFEFDRASGTYQPSALLRVLHQLRQELALFSRRRRIFNEAIREVWERAWAEHVDDKEAVAMPGFAILDLVALYDTQRNLKALLINLIDFLRGGRDTPEPVHLQTQTPVAEFQRHIDEETISVDEIRAAIDRKDPWIVSAAVNVPPEREAFLWQLAGRLREALGDDLTHKIATGQPLADEDITEEMRENLRRAIDPNTEKVE